MRVLMLGWEFPPFITGGLGTACYGLTRALDRRGIGVTFVLPKSVAGDTHSHVRLLIPEDGASKSAQRGSDHGLREASGPAGSSPTAGSAPETGDQFRHVQFLEIPMIARSVYARTDAAPAQERSSTSPKQKARSQAVAHEATAPDTSGIIGQVIPEARRETHERSDNPPGVDYNGDLISQARRYARFCLSAALTQQFDVIHAHDWLTYPAGLAVARLTGKPLIVHVHSTEFDRSGICVNQQIYDIERRGMHGAIQIVAVSQLTKNTIIANYGIEPDKVEVVYNGVEIDPTQSDNVGIGSRDKIVLYFGRITMQKGPEYFIRAAKRVLEVMDDVKFVVAGSGDLATEMIEMAASLGIGHKVLFTGFLRGRDIKRVFALADVYVMPSVSEPFGIAPLEAMSNDVPAIISKSSGVSEVLIHALKVDFWDVDDIANKIIAVLRHPPLSRTLREHAAFEVRRLTWDGAAHRCEQIYHQAMRSLVGA